MPNKLIKWIIHSFLAIASVGIMYWLAGDDLKTFMAMMYVSLVMYMLEITDKLDRKSADWY